MLTNFQRRELDPLSPIAAENEAAFAKHISAAFDLAMIIMSKDRLNEEEYLKGKAHFNIGESGFSQPLERAKDHFIETVDIEGSPKAHIIPGSSDLVPLYTYRIRINSNGYDAAADVSISQSRHVSSPETFFIMNGSDPNFHLEGKWNTTWHEIWNNPKQLDILVNTLVALLAVYDLQEFEKELKNQPPISPE